MNVPYQIKVPVDVAIDLQKRLRVLQTAHGQEMDKLDKLIKTAHGDPAKLTKRRDDLVQRGRMITMTNLLRISITSGAASVASMKDDQILKHLVDEGIAKGRPREKAVG